MKFSGIIVILSCLNEIMHPGIKPEANGQFINNIFNFSSLGLRQNVKHESKGCKAYSTQCHEASTQSNDGGEVVQEFDHNEGQKPDFQGEKRAGGAENLGAKDFRYHDEGDGSHAQTVGDHVGGQ